MNFNIGPANDRVKAQWRVVIQFARRYLGTNFFDELKMQILKSAMLYSPSSSGPVLYSAPFASCWSSRVLAPERRN